MDPNQVQRATELFQAQTHLYNCTYGYVSALSLKCAVQLGIPDIIHSHGKPITLPDLVSALHVHQAKTTCIYRLMRMLVHSGFFATTKGPNGEEEAYILTPSSRLLIKDNSNCLSPFVMSMLTPALITSLHFLADWLQETVSGNTTPFEKAHGMAFWEYNDQSPAFGRLFNDAMASDSQMMNLVIRDCKPIFDGLDSVVDVGGGTGSAARIISEAFPHMQCTVLELPRVIANLTGKDNLNFVGGDMFQHIPSADAILLKLTLHAFSDEECLKILKNCKEAISSKGEGGKVIIIDVVINEKKDEYELTETKLLFDMLMMAVVTGRERSEKEWERLFMEAGFTHYKITPLFGLRSLIEVYP